MISLSLGYSHAVLICEVACRFVRFVSTPEVLERVYTLESEILQIEEAITIQGNNDMGFNPVSKMYQCSMIDVRYHRRKCKFQFLCGR